ncbi:hypothetical protein [Helicobacter bizzozeronii]|uniref:hypothetical protein n=1 Tax=Helicobacter bizzozeronii TaxID=56877 RepID=UPI000CF1AFB8|nr:hypothetical protein [Helicobacter bizzozeronii]
MGNLSSINFKLTKLSIQENHNDRSIAPSYVLKSGELGIECNRSAKEARTLRDRLVEQAKLHYQKYRGALIAYYERGDYQPYLDFFIQAYQREATFLREVQALAHKNPQRRSTGGSRKP